MKADIGKLSWFISYSIQDNGFSIIIENVPNVIKVKNSAIELEIAEDHHRQ